MASFADAIPTILGHEGGYVNVPGDRGGETNFGISSKTYPALDIKGLTKDDAAGIYHSDFWNRYGLGEIHDQDIATYCLDCSVNHGPERGAKIAQRVANGFGAELQIDSAWGPNTRAALNGLPPDEALRGLIGERAAFFLAIVRGDPRQAKFIKGWLRRAFYPMGTP